MSIRPISKAVGFCNACLKTYPDGSTLTVFSEPVYNPEHLEPFNTSKIPASIKSDRQKAANADRSKRRAKQSIRDIMRCNPDLSVYITWTLAPDKIDRTDIKAIVSDMRTWLDNRVRRDGFKYILIPEYHHDGKGIHLHGFINDTIERVDSGHKTKAGQTIYNNPAWAERYGFTAAILIEGSRDKTVSYITKYITKGTEKLGGRWFYSGGELAKPVRTYTTIDYEPLEATEHSIDDTALHYKVIDL